MSTKYIIPKDKRKIHVAYPENPGCMVPIIYIRYYKGIVIYVGETVNYYGGRHLRPRCRELHCTLEDLDNNKFPGIRGEKEERLRSQIKWDNTDFIRILNAPENAYDRRRWEAKLVCWLNPKLQRVIKYISYAHLDEKCEKDLKIIKETNGKSIMGRLTTYTGNILGDIKDYKKFLNKPRNQWPVSGYGGKTYAETCAGRVFRTHSQMIDYKKNILSKKSVHPAVEEQANKLCDAVTKEINGLDLR